MLSDVALIAQDAVAAGDSSIAVFLESSKASLYRVTVEAGNGARGGREITVTNHPVSSVLPKEGTGLAGGAETVRTCNSVGVSIGGKGGARQTTAGSPALVDAALPESQAPAAEEAAATSRAVVALEAPAAAGAAAGVEAVAAAPA